jgi:hypothetical protein
MCEGESTGSKNEICKIVVVYAELTNRGAVK